MITWADTESDGLWGPTVTIQWADGEGKPRVHHIWSEPVRTTLKLIDHLVSVDAVGFWNLVHDWFHIQRLQNIFRLLPLSRKPTVAGWLKVERKAVHGPCVKPRKALDLFLFARRGPWQSLMNRDDIRIRRVPVALAQPLADHLTSRIELDPIYFARKQGGYGWEVCKESLEEDPGFPDVILRFRASGGLKPLSRHLLGVKAPDFPIPEELLPDEEFGWNPFHRAWTKTHDALVRYWATDPIALKYAVDDIVLERNLWKHFGSPEAGDVDSELACQVGSARWRGYAIDLKAARALHDKAEKDMNAAPRSPGAVLSGLHERMEDVEQLVVDNTRGETLTTIAGVLHKGSWSGGWEQNVPARDFARRVVVARSAEKLKDICWKFLHVKRGHPTFKIIATLSNRMGGDGGINWQGLPDEIKAILLLADGDLPVLCGGDFSAFEVTLAAAVYKDANLIADLQSGKKMHALFGSSMYGVEYDDLYDDDTEKAVDKEMYDKAKRGFFGKMYGAQDPKLASVLFGSQDQSAIARVMAGAKRFEERYPGVGEARKRITDSFCSMRQPGGIGTRVEWHEPADYVDSLFGARRYFTLENKICRALFELANEMPAEFRKIKNLKVARRAGRLQTPGGATQSAIFGAAFNIQARAMRAAANHEIQASGATITKHLQKAIWDLQPAGVNPWEVEPLNEHDSLMVPRKPGRALKKKIEGVVYDVVESFRPTVPLIKLDWKDDLQNWGAK